MNEGPYRIALRGGNGGYSVVREPSEGQKVAAALRGEPMPTSENLMRGPLSWHEASQIVSMRNQQIESTSN